MYFGRNVVMAWNPPILSALRAGTTSIIMSISQDKAPRSLEPKADCVVSDRSFGREFCQATFRVEQHCHEPGPLRHEMPHRSPTKVKTPLVQALLGRNCCPRYPTLPFGLIGRPKCQAIR